MAKWLSRADIGNSIDAHQSEFSIKALEGNRQTAASNIEYWLAPTRSPAFIFLLSFRILFSTLSCILAKRDGLRGASARARTREDNTDAGGRSANGDLARRPDRSARNATCPVNRALLAQSAPGRNTKTTFLAEGFQQHPAVFPGARFPKGCRDISSPGLNWA